MKIGFIGAGQMARALAIGICRHSPQPEIWVHDPSADAQQEFSESVGAASAHCSLAEDNQIVLDASDYVFIAVKPQNCQDALTRLQVPPGEKVFVSVVAGISTDRLREWLHTDQILRVMPNAPCLVGQGAIALATNEFVDSKHFAAIAAMLRQAGELVELPERLLDAVTGLSGSGPGFVYMFVEAMIDGGVLSGLPRDVARTLVVETIRGSICLMEANGEHPAVVRDRITSPAGTTIAGIHQLERLGFRHAVIAAIQAATERSRQLNQPAPNNSIEPA